MRFWRCFWLVPTNPDSNQSKRFRSSSLSPSSSCFCFCCRCFCEPRFYRHCRFGSRRTVTLLSTKVKRTWRFVVTPLRPSYACFERDVTINASAIDDTCECRLRSRFVVQCSTPSSPKTNLGQARRLVRSLQTGRCCCCCCVHVFITHSRSDEVVERVTLDAQSTPTSRRHCICMKSSNA